MVNGSIFMAAAVYFLNDTLIDIYSIEGAALSTLIVVAFFTLIKVLYIKFKLDIVPYSIQTIKVLGIILIMFFLFSDKDGDGRFAYFMFDYFEFELSNIFEIALNSILVLLLYLFLIYKTKSSDDISMFVRNLINGKLGF